MIKKFSSCPRKIILLKIRFGNMEKIVEKKLLPQLIVRYFFN